MRAKMLPVVGPRYHFDAVELMPHIGAFLRNPMQAALEADPPDFLFVGPQNNPIAQLLNTAGLPTRLIMASYDVEAVRVERFAGAMRGLARKAMALEVTRARRFERDNLSLYDGIIAVSDLDRQTYIREYGFTPDRVLTIENCVDSDYFAFVPPAEREPRVVYVGSLSYLPNRDAAVRLATRIMPQVRKRYPEAELYIVGQSPDEQLKRLHDGKQTVVTGKVPDVRDYLGRASVACVPLTSGSGTKLKVLEMLSAGVPLVCTALATEGLDIEDGKHCLVRASDEELAEAVIQLLDDLSLRQRLATQGRALVESRYNWDTNLTRLGPWLDELRRRPRRRDEANVPLAA
jgi:glycosyltransferase involved in cell wall biosynthesis